MQPTYLYSLWNLGFLRCTPHTQHYWCVKINFV